MEGVAEEDSLGQINVIIHPPTHTHIHDRVLGMQLAGLLPKPPVCFCFFSNCGGGYLLLMSNTRLPVTRSSLPPCSPVSILWLAGCMLALLLFPHVAMVSWLLASRSWLGTQEACPQWPCLKLSMVSLQETASSRRPALASLQVSRLWAPRWLLGFLPSYS